MRRCRLRIRQLPLLDLPLRYQRELADGEGDRLLARQATPFFARLSELLRSRADRVDGREHKYPSAPRSTWAHGLRVHGSCGGGEPAGAETSGDRKVSAPAQGIEHREIEVVDSGGLGRAGTRVVVEAGGGVDLDDRVVGRRISERSARQQEVDPA